MVYVRGGTEGARIRGSGICAADGNVWARVCALLHAGVRVRALCSIEEHHSGE